MTREAEWFPFRISRSNFPSGGARSEAAIVGCTEKLGRSTLTAFIQLGVGKRSDKLQNKRIVKLADPPRYKDWKLRLRRAHRPVATRLQAIRTASRDRPWFNGKATPRHAHTCFRRCEDTGLRANRHTQGSRASPDVSAEPGVMMPLRPPALEGDARPDGGSARGSRRESQARRDARPCSKGTRRKFQADRARSRSEPRSHHPREGW